MLKQQNHIWHSSWNWSHDLIKLGIIPCHSPRSICILHKPNRQLEWGCGQNYYPASFKSLMVALMFAIPPGIKCCFWFTIFQGRGSSNGFHLPFLNKVVLTPLVKEPRWGICQLLSISIPVIYFGTGKITTDVVEDPLSPL